MRDVAGTDVNNSIGIGELATMLTAAGVAVYVLGLVGLALSIRLSFTERWSTAWYAASLMPRTVVAGQGVRIWRRGIINVVALVIVAGLIVVAARAAGIDNADAAAIATVAGPVIFELYQWVESMRKSAGEASEAEPNGRPQRRRLQRHRPAQPPPLSRTTALIMGATGAVIALAGIFIVYRSVQIALNPLEFTANWSNITIGMLTFLIGAFFMGVPLAGQIEHPLPAITFTEAHPEAESGRSTGARVPARGWLVAHADGYWHYFDQQRILRSIPDSKVAEVRVQDDPRFRAPNA